MAFVPRNWSKDKGPGWTAALTDLEERVYGAGLTEAEVKEIIGALNAFTYKGVKDCSANPKFPAANAGDVYMVSVAGKIGGVAGDAVSVGDLLICNTDAAAEGSKAEVGAKWDIIDAQATVAAAIKVEQERAESVEAKKADLVGGALASKLIDINTAGKTSLEITAALPEGAVVAAGFVIADTTNKLILVYSGAKWMKSAALTEIE